MCALLLQYVARYSAIGRASHWCKNGFKANFTATKLQHNKPKQQLYKTRDKTRNSSGDENEILERDIALF